MRLLGLLFLLAISAAAQFNLNTSTGVVSLQSPVPCFGNSAQCTAHSNASLLGAGTTLAETDFNAGKGVSYLRVTDSATSDLVGASYHAGSSAGSNEDTFDKCNTYVMGQRQGNAIMPFAFDGVAMTASKMYSSSYKVPGSPINAVWWSRQTCGLFYTLVFSGGHAIIETFDFTSPTPPTPVPVVDLMTAPNCLNGITGALNSELNVSVDEQTFSAGISTVGTGDSGIYAVVWNRTTGCRYLKTDDCTTHGNWGTIGTCNDTSNGGSPAFYKIHETALSPDGATLTVGTNTCLTGSCGTFGIWRWTIAGLDVVGFMNNDAGGHRAMGNTGLVNKVGGLGFTGDMSYLERDYSNINPSPHAFVLNPGTAGECNYDQHASWNNNLDGTDTAPFFTTTADLQSNVTCVYGAELDIVRTDCYKTGNCTGVTPWRVAHTYSDGTITSTNFADGYAVGQVSSYATNGYYYFAYSGNWEQQFGCDDGVTYAPCSGSNPRSDLIIVRIPLSLSTSGPGLTAASLAGGASFQ